MPREVETPAPVRMMILWDCWSKLTASSKVLCWANLIRFLAGADILVRSGRDRAARRASDLEGLGEKVLAGPAKILLAGEAEMALEGPVLDANLVIPRAGLAVRGSEESAISLLPGGVFKMLFIVLEENGRLLEVTPHF